MSGDEIEDRPKLRIGRAQLAMRVIAIAAATIAASAIASAQSPPQPIDLSAVTCEGFPQSLGDQLPMVLVWLSGRYAAPSDPPVIDPARFGETAQKIAGYCHANPASPLIAAAQATLVR